MEKSGYLIEPSCNGYPHVAKGDCSNAVNSKSVMDKMRLSKYEMKTLLPQLFFYSLFIIIFLYITLYYLHVFTSTYIVKKIIYNYYTTDSLSKI